MIEHCNFSYFKLATSIENYIRGIQRYPALISLPVAFVNPSPKFAVHRYETNVTKRFII